MYVNLIEEMRERWRMECEAALIGWHMAGVMAESEVPRPTLPEWLDVKATFDEWLCSPIDGRPVAEDRELPPEEVDTMIAMGWR